MEPRIGIKEIIILVAFIATYVFFIELTENRVEVARQGQMVQQEQGFTYQPPESPDTVDPETIVIDIEN